MRRYPEIMQAYIEQRIEKMYMIICLLLRRFSNRDDLPKDPLARLTPDELADLPPWHAPKRN